MQKAVIHFSVSNDRLTPSMISEFEKNNPTISIQRVDPKQYYMLNHEKSIEQLDIISISVEDFPYYVGQGLAMNLSPYMNKNPLFAEELISPDLSFLKFENKAQGKGEYFGFLNGWFPGYILLFNKSLFDAAGVDYLDSDQPMTWNQLLELAQKLTIKKDGQLEQYSFGIAGQKTMIDLPLYLLQMEQLGKTPWYDQHNKADFTSDESKTIFEYWNKALQANLGPNLMNQVTEMPEQLFLDNRLAILMVDYGFAMQMEQSKGELSNYGIAPTPVFENGKSIHPILTKSAAIIQAKTKYPNEAWKVFEWFFTGEHTQQWVMNGNELPVFKADLDKLPQSTEWTKQVAEYYQSIIPYSRSVLDFNPHLPVGVVNNIFDKYLVPVYFGKSEFKMMLYSITQDVNFQIENSRQYEIKK
ncbi:ABC transporter substrate-binding protein [Paenibacillus sp. GCM10028914]|uniref:ABC transporter substrate-binding protein n=1 Tax=Paenibacillus sp. GCM10028914 TaxID=3273416 RepID=UPI0036108CA6